MQQSSAFELIDNISDVAALKQQLGANLLNRLRPFVIQHFKYSKSCWIEAFHFTSGHGMFVNALEGFSKYSVQMQ
ncbi:hypothetical protein D3C75_1154580 [compost metagenome]